MRAPYLPARTIEYLRNAGYLVVPERCVARTDRIYALSSKRLPVDEQASLEERRVYAALRTAVSETFDIEEATLLSPSRMAALVRARQIGMLVARDRLGFSEAKCATAFARYDPTTARHSIRRLEAMVPKERRKVRRAADAVLRRFKELGGRVP